MAIITLVDSTFSGREAMSSVKQRFETASEGREFASEQREEVGQLKRSEAERKRVLAQFMEVGESPKIVVHFDLFRRRPKSRLATVESATRSCTTWSEFVLLRCR